VVICLERGADLHIAQLMPLPLTVSCFSKIQIGLPFWYRLTRVVLEKRAVNGCVWGSLSSKLAERRCCCRWTGQTDGRTDARPFHRLYSAYYAAVSIKARTMCSLYFERLHIVVYLSQLVLRVVCMT